MRPSTWPTRSTTLKRLLGVGGAVAGALLIAVVAFGLWTTSGAGGASASVGTLNPATNVAASPVSSTVAVSWTAAAPAGGLTPQGYFVTRVSTGDGSQAAACGSDSSHLVTGSSCSDTSVPSGNYRYLVTAAFATWTAASAPSSAVMVDGTPPANSLSLVAQSGGGSYLVAGSGIVFYRGSGSGTGGSFAIRNTVTDAGGSGAASSTTAALAGTSTGWTHTPGTDSSPAGGPFDSNAFAWAEGTTSQPTETVTAADTAGNTTPATLTFTNDSTAPAGGALKVNGISATAGGVTSGNTTGGFTIAIRTDYTEAQSTTASGLVSSVLTMQSASISGGSCGSFGSASILIGKPTQSGLSTGCYLFTLTGTDNVGNTASLSTTVIVDLTPPATPSLAFSALNNASYSSSLNTLFFRKVAGGTYVVSASSSDAESGLASGNAGYTFTPLSGNGFTGTQSGGQVSYTFGTTATQPVSARTVAANNGAGGSSGTASYTAILDSAAPAGGALTVNGIVATGGGATSLVTTAGFAIDARTDWSEVQSAAASGLAASTLVRDQATLTNNVCGSFGSATTISGTPTQNAAAGISSGNCYRYTLTGTDQVGNSASVAVTIKVDTAAPTTTDNTAAIGNAWKSTTQTVTLTPSDPNGSGIAATYYTTDGSTPTTSSTQGTTISLSTTGQYTIQYFSLDNAGNVEPVETASAVIRIDKVVPTSSISLGSASGAFLNAARLYYKSNAAGSFTLTNTVADADSGAGSGTFPAVPATGWTHNAETVSTPAGGPFTSSLYSWSASPGAPAAAARTFTGADVAGNTSASTVLTFTADNTAPTGGALTVNGTAASLAGTTSTATAVGVSISSRTDYTEALSTTQSGLASSILTIQSETLSNAVCGAPGSGGPYQTATVVSGTSAPSLTLGFCYVYSLAGTDQVGNTAAVSTTVIAAALGVTNFSSANGGPTVGKPEAGDTISVTFNTALNPSSVPATGTITLCSNVAGCSASTHTLITINGLTSAAGFDIANSYEKSGFTQTIAGTFSLSADHLTVTFTITGASDANAKKDITTAAFTFAPNAALQDLAGDAASGTYTTPAAIALF